MAPGSYSVEHVESSSDRDLPVSLERFCIEAIRQADGRHSQRRWIWEPARCSDDPVVCCDVELACFLPCDAMACAMASRMAAEFDIITP